MLRNRLIINKKVDEPLLEGGNSGGYGGGENQAPDWTVNKVEGNNNGNGGGDGTKFDNDGEKTLISAEEFQQLAEDTRCKLMKGLII